MYNKKLTQASTFDKAKHFFKGFLIAAFVFVAVVLFLYLIQADFTPMRSLSDYLMDSNSEQNDLLVSASDQAVYFKYKIPKLWEETALLFSKSSSKGVQIYLNNSIIFDNAQEPHVSVFRSDAYILDLRDPSIAFPAELEIQIEKDGYLQLKNNPLVGNYGYLSVFSKINAVFGDYLMLILSGIAFLLAFIMFSVSFSDKEMLLSFLPIALAASYYSFFFFINAVFYNNPGYFFREDFISLGGMLFSLDPLTLYGIFSGLAMFSMIALFSGVEKFLFDTWKMTRLLFFISIFVYPFIFIFPFMVFYGNFFVIICFFAVLTFRSNIVLFNFLTALQLFVGMHMFISHQIYPLWTFHIYSLGSLITLSGYGIFFIMNLNKLIYSKKRFERLASHDELTGVTNRRTFTNNLNTLIESATYPWTLVFIDVDRLKQINDLYGHAKGDEVLFEIGETLKDFTRRDDLVARLGGDEFVLVLVGDKTKETLQVMERIQENLKDKNEKLALELPLSISYGMTTVTASDELNLKDIINTADERMYEQKKEKGANR
ncbi:MAG: GGDEF domain-containing protein [Thermotogota bacterium]